MTKPKKENYKNIKTLNPNLLFYKVTYWVATKETLKLFVMWYN